MKLNEPLNVQPQENGRSWFEEKQAKVEEPRESVLGSGIFKEHRGKVNNFSCIPNVRQDYRFLNAAIYFCTDIYRTLILTFVPESNGERRNIHARIMGGHAYGS